MWLCKWIQLSSPVTEYVVTSDNVCYFFSSYFGRMKCVSRKWDRDQKRQDRESGQCTTSKITKKENDHVTKTKQESKYLSTGNVRNHGIRVWSTTGAQLDNAHTGW